MRRMNSVCFVQSCHTLWDTVFLPTVYLMKELCLCYIKKTVGFWCAVFKWGFCDPQGVKWKLYFVLIIPVLLWVCCTILHSISTCNTSPFPLICSLQWTRTWRKAPDQVASRCPPAATSIWDQGWTATFPKMTDKKTRLEARKRKNLNGIKRGRETRTRAKPRKACWRAWARCSGKTAHLKILNSPLCSPKHQTLSALFNSTQHTHRLIIQNLNAFSGCCHC